MCVCVCARRRVRARETKRPKPHFWSLNRFASGSMLSFSSKSSSVNNDSSSRLASHLSLSLSLSLSLPLSPTQDLCLSRAHFLSLDSDGSVSYSLARSIFRFLNSLSQSPTRLLSSNIHSRAPAHTLSLLLNGSFSPAFFALARVLALPFSRFQTHTHAHALSRARSICLSS